MLDRLRIQGHPPTWSVSESNHRIFYFLPEIDFDKLEIQGFLKKTLVKIDVNIVFTNLRRFCRFTT